jgi:hypothetical protein
MIVKGLKDQIKRMVQFSQQAPQVKIMEPLVQQPVSSFEFAFKIRVSVCTAHVLRVYCTCMHGYVVHEYGLYSCKSLSLVGCPQTQGCVGYCCGSPLIGISFEGSANTV